MPSPSQTAFGATFASLAVVLSACGTVVDEPTASRASASPAALTDLLLTTDDLPEGFTVTATTEDPPESTDLPHPIANECDRQSMDLGAGETEEVIRYFQGLSGRREVTQSISTYASPGAARAALQQYRDWVGDCPVYEYEDAGDTYEVRLSAETPPSPEQGAFAFTLDSQIPAAPDAKASIYAVGIQDGLRVVQVSARLRGEDDRKLVDDLVHVAAQKVQRG